MTNWYLPPCEPNGEAVIEYNFERQDNGTAWMIVREERTITEKIREELQTFVVDDSTGFDLLRHINLSNMLSCQSNY